MSLGESGAAMRRWFFLLLIALCCAPLVAVGDTRPQLVSAEAGPDGAIQHVTLKFSEAMVALGDPRAVSPVTVSCPVGVHGHWVDVQTYVVDFDKTLPGGLKCKVSLRADLRTVRGESVGGQRETIIYSGGPTARAVLGGTEFRIDEDQVFLVAPNVAPLPESISANAYCAVEGIGEKIPVDVLPDGTAAKLLRDAGYSNYRISGFIEEAGAGTRTPGSYGPAGLKVNEAALNSIVAVKCRRMLPPGHEMSLVWSANIAAAGGLLAGRDQRFDFSVRKAFMATWECSRTSPKAGCNPIESATLRFTSPVPVTKAEAVRLTFADGTALTPALSDSDKKKGTADELTFKGPLPAATTATISLPADFTDASGRMLENAARFPLAVRVDEAPPLVKFAAPFGIVEANEGGILPVTVRNVEPALAQNVKAISGQQLRIDASDGQIAAWLRTINKHEDSNFGGGEDDKPRINHTGDTPLLDSAGSHLKFDLPGHGKTFEVVGIPLKSPGFYVVELASPTLGKALLGRNATRYVAAGALVTNMAVHFKWGREGSLAWITTLDKAQVVAGAEVRISDSCTGQMLARGTSDAQGRLAVKGLPEPVSSGECEGVGAQHPLMISARKAGDFSFTLTEWSKGIQPYDFELPYGDSKPDDILHTVFDRSLIRAGETVNMKHILRRPTVQGFSFAQGFSGTLVLTHEGSDTKFEMPVTIGADGIGESRWTAPQGAPQGDYQLSFKSGDKEISTEQSIRVDEFRIPTMRASITGPKQALVKPSSVPLDLFVGFFSGGGAAHMPVIIRTSYSARDATPKGWDGWSFGGAAPVEGVVPLNADGEEDAPATQPLAAALPLTLGAGGSARTSVDLGRTISDATTMQVEMDYQDANGETLTTSQRIPLYASSVQLGVKSDGWLMRNSDVRLKLAALDLDGKPLRGQTVKVEVFTREILTARRRLIGGFYAYDSQARTTRAGSNCVTITDQQGLASCQLSPGVSGEVYVVATTTDQEGNVSRAVKTIWLAGEDEWWFGGDNGDRMDVVPERKEYKAGETAKFQVRMPFRSATALITVEREGVISSFVTELSGKDPVVNVPMPGAYAPDVYVSVLAVRGRVSTWTSWLHNLMLFLHLSSADGEAREPTALVDLAKPSYRIGIAKVNVGWESHALDVTVTPEKTRYGVRETANVDVAVKAPSGKLPAGSEIAFVAVDEALLTLKPNESTDVLTAMMGERPLGVLTSTAQMQVVGKRHYGRKAVAAGGGGGGGGDSAITRDNFRPLLLWEGRVKLDSRGHARVSVPLVDSLSSYKLIAIATGGAELFGTGSATIHTAQDLSIYAGLPPVVRSGDWYGASFTLHNGTDHPMTVQATMAVTPAFSTGGPLTVTIPAGAAAPVTWNVTAPNGAGSLNWHIEAHEVGGRASDKVDVAQALIPAVPTEVWAAMLTRGGAVNGGLSLLAPDGALPGQGFVDVKLSNTLAPPLGSVRDYMSLYPYNCFEQRLSRIVALSDSAGWDKLAKDIPAYLDSDGLLRYFPDERMRGSEALTSYVLAIAAEDGLTIPNASRARMIGALQAVAAGTLKHEVAWAADGRLIRIAALGALARQGAATPTLVAGAYVAPTDAPTSVLVDWLIALDATKTHPDWKAAAEHTLRARLVYAGSRVDLTDGANEPWYIMSSHDEAAIKALTYALGRAGWNDDVPKLMVGVALRQQRGHWDTTPANAWGVVAAQRFAKLYPANAITGVTTVALGNARASQSWPMSPGAAPLRLPLPFAKSALVVTQSSGTAPWALVSVNAAVPLKAPLFTGYRITREVSAIQQKVAGSWSRGDVMKVRLTIEASAGRTWVVINDPVPPGATILNDLGGQSSILASQTSSGNAPSYVDRGQGYWRGFYEWMPAGGLTAEYAVRLNGTGRFSLPPTRVEAMYSPDIRGQLPNGSLEVVMR